ncbi:MAG: helicase C-terminal domain-containing protein [archaeon]
MWSLYKRTDATSDKRQSNSKFFGPFDTEGEELKPLLFSNNKTQADVVKEILDAINAGNKLIFIKGVCGTGKSAIALNLARHFKKTSIIVPIKSLQEQYEKDYTKNKFILKQNKKPLDIAVIKGRNNFRCPFAEKELPTTNCQLPTADSPDLPCTIEIREKNTAKLLGYINKNPLVSPEDFKTASDIRRMNIAPACPYWSPLIPADIKPKGLTDFKKIKYEATCGKEFALFQRKKGCAYYDQCEAYANADVLIFNSAKYQIETMIGRKPKTDLDIVDECDEFLDSFANERKINLNRLHTALSNLAPQKQTDKTIIKKLIREINDAIYSEEIEIQKIKQSPIIKIIKTAIENPNLAEDEELNYYNTLVEIAQSFKNLLDETYISIEKTNKDSVQNKLFNQPPSTPYHLPTTFVTIVSINLAQKLKELIEQNNVLVMMSGTLHSEQVLKDIFGLKDFKTIEAETQNPGTINKQRTGLEKNCAFQNFKDGTITRNQYLKILDMCMAKAEPPTLVHISAFSDLPTNSENETLKLENLITQEKLSELQSKGNTAVDKFTSGETDILFTTKCARGVDFPGDKCNSIVITKFPYPNIQGLFWKILKKEQPQKFMEFYLDKARRDLYQKIARGIRFKGDKVNLYSPDIRVLNANQIATTERFNNSK